MKRVLGVGLAFVLAIGTIMSAGAGEGMGSANYKEAKGTIYSWVGFPGPSPVPANAIILLEKQGPVEVIIGDTFSYQIHISNRSAVDIVAVTLEDTIPDSFAVESIEPKPSRDSGGRLFWDLGSIPAKSAKLITITGRALQLGCIVSNALAKICYEMPLPLSTRVIQCNVDVQKTLPAVADLCDPIPMCITVFNTGSAPATNVCLTDQLPEGLLTKDGKSEINILIGTIPVGGSKTFNIELKATRTGEFTNTAVVRGDRNCYAQSTASVKVVAPNLELKAFGPADGYICTSLPYEITVTNTGTSPARDVILTDTIAGKDVKIEKISDNGKATRNRIAWALGTLNPGESRTVCVVLSSTAEGPINSEMAVSAKCTEPKKVNHCLTLVGVPGILTSLKDDCDPVIVGGKVTYTITASNTGSRDATNLRYTITLDEGMEYLGGSGVTAVSSLDAKTVQFAPLPVLAKGATATWTVTVNMTSVGDKRFRTALLANELSGPVQKDEATTVYQPSMAVVVAQ